MEMKEGKKEKVKFARCFNRVINRGIYVDLVVLLVFLSLSKAASTTGHYLTDLLYNKSTNTHARALGGDGVHQMINADIFEL
jgi:hypothetical protein